MKKPFFIYLLSFLALGCGKEFLDIKRDSNQVVPSTIQDYLAILNRREILDNHRILSFIGTDEYYYDTYSDLVAQSSFTPFHKKAYTWEKEIFEVDEQLRDWNKSYENIMYANLALDVEKITPKPGEEMDWKRTVVAARFHRAWKFYQLAQQFCGPYNGNTSSSALGLPLRTDYDVSVKYSRSTLKEVYDLILNDLHHAEEVNLDSDLNIYLPGRLAVKALLARVYLQIGKYEKAEHYSISVLKEKSDLVDYNLLNGNLEDYYDSHFNTLGKNNPAIIFYSQQSLSGIISESMKMDTTFIESLHDSDLRKEIYFFDREDGAKIYVGSYCGYGVSRMFTGLSTEEMMLIAAECLARKGDHQLAKDALKPLLKVRFRDGKIPDDMETEADVLGLVLKERKKELFMRGIFWDDARRLNLEGKYTFIFKRNLEDKEYVLAPNDKRWTWPIPTNEVTNNNLQQNER
ncbi:MAG: RagB/SusD family nutrient uptake outer membrane protein [Sphingobacterium mizutaii]|nr:RagB/SusD family nutrient uptake outer membrane protein [Sphingobacterium mizutaii]